MASRPVDRLSWLSSSHSRWRAGRRGEWEAVTAAAASEAVTSGVALAAAASEAVTSGVALEAAAPGEAASEVALEAAAPEEAATSGAALEEAATSMAGRKGTRSPTSITDDFTAR
jgi:hypothetical protein